MKAPHHSKLAAAQAPRVESKTVRYRAEQEYLLRRLGAALVVQWDVLPDELQDLLIDQAAAVEDREDAPHGASDIEHFIRSVKLVAIARPARAERDDAGAGES